MSEAHDFAVIETPASRWVGGPLQHWGCSYPVDQTLDSTSSIGGIGTLDAQSFPTLVPDGPPRLREVRFSVEPGVPTLASGDGFLLADIVSGVGNARHKVTVDVFHGARVLVPGGTIQVTLRQTATMQRAIQSVALAVATFAGGDPQATYSERAAPATPSGPLMVWLKQIPSRAKRLALDVDPRLGAVEVEFLDSQGQIISWWTTAGDPDLRLGGVPVPANADAVQLTYPPIAPPQRTPVARWSLDC